MRNWEVANLEAKVLYIELRLNKIEKFLKVLDERTSITTHDLKEIDEIKESLKPYKDEDPE